MNLEASALLLCNDSEIGCVVEMPVSHYLVATYSPCLPAARIEARILLLVFYSALYP